MVVVDIVLQKAILDVEHKRQAVAVRHTLLATLVYTAPW
jgi:hypothetical protein